MSPQNNKVIPFLIGIVFGWQGVRMITHLFYLTIISGMIAYHLYH